MSIAACIEDAIQFTVPHLIPPSVNHYTRSCYYVDIYGGVHKGKKLTPEAQAFRDAVAIFARGRTVAPPTAKERMKARYGVRIDVYLGPGQRGDFDNFWKSGLDALVRCTVIHSDAAVDGEHSKCVVHKDDRENPRTEYVITRLETN
jgi:Holliday junction resolvase RusA-like endonuclease